MPNASKKRRYAILVRDRKQCRLCVRLLNPVGSGLAKFDSGLIGPWTRLHGDLDAELMIVGKDWGGVDYYKKHCGLDKLTNPTMVTLERFLQGIGMDVSLTEYGANHSGIFLTNASLCLKGGGLQAAVQREWFANCQSFLRRQVDIVSPGVVVGLGQRAYEATMEAFDLDPGPFRAAVEHPSGT